jgi:hypothetical protein
MLPISVTMEDLTAGRKEHMFLRGRGSFRPDQEERA